MEDKWIGKAVSIQCDEKLGIFQGIIKDISASHITIVRAFRNGVPMRMQDAEVTLRSLDIVDISLIPPCAGFNEAAVAENSNNDDNVDAENTNETSDTNKENVLAMQPQSSQLSCSDINYGGETAFSAPVALHPHVHAQASASNSSSSINGYFSNSSPPLSLPLPMPVPVTLPPLATPRLPNNSVAQFFGYMIPHKVEARLISAFATFPTKPGASVARVGVGAPPDAKAQSVGVQQQQQQPLGSNDTNNMFDGFVGGSISELKITGSSGDDAGDAYLAAAGANTITTSIVATSSSASVVASSATNAYSSKYGSSTSPNNGCQKQYQQQPHSNTIGGNGYQGGNGKTRNSNGNGSKTIAGKGQHSTGNGNGYGNGGHNSENSNGNGNSNGNRKQSRSKQLRRENSVKQTFDTSADDPELHEDFDFEGNLALFDKKAIWNVIESEHNPDAEHPTDASHRQRRKKQYRHDENVLVSEPPQLRQIESLFDGSAEFVTDEGLVIPTIPFYVRSKIELLAEKGGLSLQRQIDTLARGAADLAILLLGGARRLTPTNCHQWPTVTILCEKSENFRTTNAGAATGRQLAAHGMQVFLYLEDDPAIEKRNNEISLFKATGNQTVYSIDALPTPDLVIIASNSINLATDVKKWLNENRASIFAIDPPPCGIRDIAIKYSLLPILPLNGISSENCGKLYLCNLGIPNKFYTDSGIKYKSPFGHKYVIPIHSKY